MAKRWYEMKLEGPLESTGSPGNPGYVCWIVNTHTRFDYKAGGEVAIDVKPFFSSVTGKRFELVKPDWFKESGRRSEGDPKRGFNTFNHRWHCAIGKEKEGRFHEEHHVIIETDDASKPHAQAMNAVRSYAANQLPEFRIGLTYVLRGPEVGDPFTIRYVERVDGFTSLWHFQIAYFHTKIIIEGVRK